MFIDKDAIVYEITNVLADAQIQIKPAFSGDVYSGTDWSIAPTAANLKVLSKSVTDLVAIYQDIPENVEVAQGAVAQTMVYRNEAVSAKGAAELAQQATEIWRNQAVEARDSAESAVSEVTAKASEVEAARIVAAQAALDAAAASTTAQDIVDSASASLDGKVTEASVAASAAAASAQNAASTLATSVKTEDLASASTLAIGGFSKDESQNILDNALPMQSYTALRGYAGRARGVRITTPGIAGFFQLDSSDTTSSDNGGTIIVGVNGRRWKRIFDGTINALWFGADKSGVVSASTSFNLFIAALNSIQNVRGLVPFGKYNLRAGVTQKITGDGISITGENALIYAATGNIFDFDSGTLMRRGQVSGFTFQYDFPTVSVAAQPIRASRLLYWKSDNIYLQNAPAAVKLIQCSNFEVDRIYGDVANVARATFDFQSCVVGAIDNIGTITAAGLQPLNPATPYTSPPVAGCNFISISGSTDTLRFGSKVLSNRYHRGLVAVVNPGEIFLNTSFDHPVFDYCYDKSIHIENTGGSIANISLVEPYCQAAGGDGYQGSGAGVGIGIHVKHGAVGVTQGIKLIRPFVFASGSDGIVVESGDTTILRDVLIDTPNVRASNRLGAGGVDVKIIKARVDVVGGAVGRSSVLEFTPTVQGTIGLSVDGSDRFSVMGVTAGGSAASFQFVNLPSTNYRGRLSKDNRAMPGMSVGTKPEYETSVSAVVVSGGIYTNVSPFIEQISVYADGATAAATVLVNGVQVTSHTEWSGLLNPGDTIQVTTGVASTMRRTRLP